MALELLPLVPGQSVHLTNWFPFVRSGGATLSTLTNTESIYLRIDAPQSASAGWRSRAVIPEGDYIFSCNVIAKESPIPLPGHIPVVLLRLGGDLGGAALTTVGQWQSLSYRFIVPSGGRSAEFLCELQAGRGDIWIDLHSISVAKYTSIPAN